MRELEKEAIRRAEDELATLAEALAASGHTYQDPEIENWSSDPADYASELRVMILRDGEIDDVLEFHVFLNGEPQVSGVQVAEWIRSQLLAILREGKGK